MARTQGPVVAECDQAGKRRDQSTCTADIYPQEKLPVVIRKTGKQDRRGDITDDLAGTDAHQESAFAKEAADKFLNGGDPGHVARENKEKRKRGKKSPVNFGKRFFVRKEKNCRNDDQADPIRDQAENDQERECEKRQIQSSPRLVEFSSGVIFDLKFRTRHEKTKYGQKHDGKHKWREHDRHKLTCRDLVLGIKIEILRVSERSQHTAEVSGNILKDENICHLFLILRNGKCEVSEWKKCDQSHIISDQHRADKCDINESQCEDPEISGGHDDSLGDDTEKADVFQCADHSER